MLFSIEHWKWASQWIGALRYFCEICLSTSFSMLYLDIHSPIIKIVDRTKFVYHLRVGHIHSLHIEINRSLHVKLLTWKEKHGNWQHQLTINNMMVESVKDIQKNMATTKNRHHIIVFRSFFLHLFRTSVPHTVRYVVILYTIPNDSVSD